MSREKSCAYALPWDNREKKGTRNKVLIAMSKNKSLINVKFSWYFVYFLYIRVLYHFKCTEEPGCIRDSLISSKMYSRNTPVSNYASVPANNNLKSRLVLSCREYTANVLHSTALASTSGYCSRQLKRIRNWSIGEKNESGKNSF